MVKKENNKTLLFLQLGLIESLPSEDLIRLSLSQSNQEGKS